MRNLFLSLILATLTTTLNAQKSSMIYVNASVKYKRVETAGTVLTAVGGAALFTGNILFWKVYNGNDNKEPREDKAARYGHIMLGGLGLMAVGIPLWATGRSKLRHIEIEAGLFNFKGPASVNGVGINLRFNLSQLHNPKNN
jgi:hypothetical protein